MWNPILLDEALKAQSNYRTAASQRDRALQENCALRAKVEELKRELSQCRVAMVSCSGFVTEIRAASEELMAVTRQAGYDQQRKQNPFVRLSDGRFSEKRKNFLAKLHGISWRATLSHQVISAAGKSDGTQKRAVSCCQSSREAEKQRAACYVQ